MTADLIVYAVVAAALIFWLRSILGTRNGQERERDNPFAPRTPDQRSQADDDKPAIDVPYTAVPGGAAPMRVTKTTLVGRVKIEPGAEDGLRQIAQHDRQFNLDRFMEGAEYAFELIITSFAKGDRNTLRMLLTPAVYNDFDAALTDRMTRGETCETRIEAVRGMDVMAARIKDDIAYVSVRFTAQETCLIRNAVGTVIAGEPDKTTTMIDIWTFGRNLGIQDPTWHLYETRDEQPEPHKTPIPESQ